MVPGVHKLDRIVIAVGKGQGQIKSAIHVKICVIHVDIIIIIINTIVVIMFLALKGVGVIVLWGETADGKRTQ